MKIIKSFIKAILYFLLYFGVQIVASIIFGVAIAVKIRMSVPMEEFDAAFATAIERNTMLLSLITNIITIFAVWLVFKIRKRSLFSELDIKKIRLIGAVALVVFGACMNIVMSMLLEVLPLPEAWWADYNESASAVTSDFTIVGILAAAVLAPITEELVFRGLLYRSIADGCGIWIGAVLSALVFGIMHGSLIWAIYAAILGFILAMIYAKTRSLLCPMLVHFGFNGVNYIISGMTFYFVILSFILAAVSAVMICVFNVADAKE